MSSYTSAAPYRKTVTEICNYSLMKVAVSGE
jgi:hypothetical protein